jgi:alpha-beta hydrolase superfamily lysophospholipase
MSVHSGHAATIPSSEFRFSSTHGLHIACARWDSRVPAQGVVRIAHGMGEHIRRYTDTIEVLVSAGFTVHGNDHRGYGRTAPSARYFGDFGEGGFDLLVEDMARLSRIARDENPEQPFFLLGHSMGSFAAQQYVLDHSRELDGLILSGSGTLDGLARLASSAPAHMNILNAPFEPAPTSFDWLSRDSAVVDAFIKDPFCFAELQPAALAPFLAAATRLSDPKSSQNTPGLAHLPVLTQRRSRGPATQRSRAVD